MRKKITKKQIKEMVENINKLAESEEGFVFIVFKEKGSETDSITQYAYNFPRDKLDYYFMKFSQGVKG